MTSIYVSIPSLNDSEIFKTIDDCFNNSSKNNDVYIGVAHSVLFKSPKLIKKIEDRLLEYKNLKNIFINTNSNEGVGPARLASASMYNGQDYFLQIDAHTKFEKNWDEFLLHHFNSAKNYFNLKNIAITSYLPGYKYSSKEERVPAEDDCHPMYPYYISNDANDLDCDCESCTNGFWFDSDQEVKLYEKIPKWITTPGKKHYSDIKKVYELSTKFNANFLFSDKKFAENYTKFFPWPFLFYEEEFIMTIEMINFGYIPVYVNTELPMMHLYADYFNEFYPGRDHINPSKEKRYQIKDTVERYFDNNKEKIEKYCKYAGLKYPEILNKKWHYTPSIEDARLFECEK